MMPKIWIADDDSSIRWVFEKAFEDYVDFDYKIFDSGEELIESLKSDKPELLIINAIIAANNNTSPLAASSLKNHLKG